MSISYVSNRIIFSSVKYLTNEIKEYVEFTRQVNNINNNKSVTIRVFRDKNDNKRFLVNFYGFEKQSQIETILKSFRLMLDTKFVHEDDFKFF